MDVIKKITSKNGNTYLFIDVPHKQRNDIGIASGKSVLLSIEESDPFYFNEDIQLIHYESILKVEEPSEKEKEFFEYVMKNTPVGYKKSLAKKYDISKYVKKIKQDDIYSNAKKLPARNKGSIKYLFPDEYVVVDIETTGLSSSFDDIIEIGAAKVNDKTEIVETFSMLINPNFPQRFEISAFINDLTGITTEEINQKGLRREEVLMKFKDFIGESLVVAHNASFDLNFLYDAIKEDLNIEFSNDFIDTMQIARWYAFKKPEMDRHRVEDFVKKFDLKNEVPNNLQHRALNDVLFEKQIFDIERNKLGEAWTRAVHQTKSRKSFDINVEADNHNPFFGLKVVFTGKLDEFTRDEAHEFIANAGGTPESSLKVDTDLLVVGTLRNRGEAGEKSTKLKKAEKINVDGKGEITIISAHEFLKMVAEMI